jgi:hypothetical protein
MEQFGVDGRPHQDLTEQVLKHGQQVEIGESPDR